MKGKALYLSLVIIFVYACLLLGYSFGTLPFVKAAWLWLSGFVAFTFIEYLFHRFFFHMAANTETKKNLQYAVHGNHHAAPSDTTGVMMKPSIAVIMLVFLSALFYALFRWNALALLPGFLFGYSCYLFIHFAIHAYKPPRNFLRRLWKLHNLHHFDDDHRNYGVSSPFWDIVFNTYSPAKKTKRRPDE